MMKARDAFGIEPNKNFHGFLNEHKLTWSRKGLLPSITYTMNLIICYDNNGDNKYKAYKLIHFIPKLLRRFFQYITIWDISFT